MNLILQRDGGLKGLVNVIIVMLFDLLEDIGQEVLGSFGTTKGCLSNA